jgi:uncharacterized membrane protein YeaQ/YmgE (transglycosylase-associated protein family)
MLIFGWIVVGLASGLLASRIVANTGEGTVVDILLGVGGAIAAGWLFAFAGASGLNIRSLVAAVVGASVVLFLYHAFFRRPMML